MIDLDAIRARLAAATPGPWAACIDTHPLDRYWESTDVVAVDRLPIPNLVYADTQKNGWVAGEAVSRWADGHCVGHVAGTHNDGAIPDEQHDGNQRLIAHAPTDLAALLAEVERLRRRLRLLGDVIEPKVPERG